MTKLGNNPSVWEVIAGPTPAPSQTRRRVEETPDFQRIRDLPRRDWRQAADLDQLVQLLTEHLRYNDTPCAQPDACEGCIAKTLKPSQASALRELHDLGPPYGAFLPLRPGAGKTLVSFLAGTITGAKRPLLIVPAAQKERDGKPGKTELALAQYARHYKITPFRLISYEWLSHPSRLDWLGNYKPDLIVCDEAHKLKDPGTKAAKRIRKYLKSSPETRYVAMTGSPGERSIMESWHTIRWALRDRAPVPKDPMEARAWAYALDEKVPPDARLDPEVLLQLEPDAARAAAQAGEDELSQARAAFGVRLTSTRGVVSTYEDIPPVTLRLWASVVDLPPELTEAIVRMRETWVTPGGEEFNLAVHLWRHASTLGCGLHYMWDPPPPPEWRAARGDLYAWEREQLVHARTIDSVVHLREQVRSGERDDGGRLAAWEAIKHTYDPEKHKKAVWVSDHMLEHAASWLAGGDHRVCWVQDRALGERLAELTGLPFYADGGLDASGRLIDEHRKGPAIASSHSCREGHNLQRWFYENLITRPSTRGGREEQRIARTHRDHQVSDEVTAEYLLTCREAYQALAQACRDALFSGPSYRQPQKLVYADKDFSAVEALIKDGTNPLWKAIGV